MVSRSFSGGSPNFKNSAAFTAAVIFPLDFQWRQKFGGSGYSAAARKVYVGDNRVILGSLVLTHYQRMTDTRRLYHRALYCGPRQNDK